MFQAQLQITDQDIRTVQSQTQQSGSSYTADISGGQEGATRDNRHYVFGLNNSSTAATPGTLQTGIATTANHVSRTLTTAVAAGATTVFVPLGATLATQDQYAGGFLTIISGPGAGISYKIKGNTATASSGTMTVSLTEKEPVTVALTTSSVVSLYPSPWTGFAIASTTVASNNLIGVPNVAVPVSNYAWLQIGGYCSVLADASPPTKAVEGVASSATAGAVSINTTSTVTQTVGYAVETMVSAQYQNMFLRVQ